jgi:tetratricopeptide (TPR) repeat protein
MWTARKPAPLNLHPHDAMPNGRRAGRPAPAPPAILRSNLEGYDGATILDELRSPVGVVLWQTVHDLILWASTPPERRGALWDRRALAKRDRQLREADLEDQLRPWLTVLGGILREGRAVPVEELVGAARKVSDWADATGLPKTAIWYAQAAALIAPMVAEYAFHVGTLCHFRLTDHTRAVTWYARAIGLSKRRADPVTYSRAYRRMGQILMQRGAFEVAERAFRRAYKYARRSGERAVAGEALHDLFSLAVETGRKREAEELANRAFTAYPPAHPRLVMLAHDVAVLWMLQGHHARALPILQSVRAMELDLGVRLMVVSGIARAAGGAGDRDAFLSAWVETWGIIDANPHLECVTSSLVRLAYGSASLGDRERVELAAGYGLELAVKRVQTPFVEEARALLEGTAKPASVPEGPTPAVVEQLAERLTTRLRRRSRSAARTGPGEGPSLRC